MILVLIRFASDPPEALLSELSSAFRLTRKRKRGTEVVFRRKGLFGRSTVVRMFDLCERFGCRVVGMEFHGG